MDYFLYDKDLRHEPVEVESDQVFFNSFQTYGSENLRFFNVPDFTWFLLGILKFNLYIIRSLGYFSSQTSQLF